MKIRTVEEVENTDRDVMFTGGYSKRLILKEDGMGFSFMKTIVPKGGPHHWHYKHHLESCYCIQGKGILTNLDTKEVFNIEVDTVYSLDDNDNHTFEAIEDVILMSVFNPPVTGLEIHQEDGSYKIELAKEIVHKISECTNDYDAIDEVNELLKIR